MSVTVHFINKSGERVELYRTDGSILRVLESGKRWNRDPKEGTLDTVHVDEVHGQKFPPRRERPYWIDKTEWTYEECHESEIFAPFRTIIFMDNNVVKLRKRPRWKPPELKWPVVTFLFKSHKMKMIKERLDHDMLSEASIFYNGIPVRRTVHALSKYAPYKKWFFSEVMELKDVNPPYRTMAETYEITEHGESKRPAAELEKIEQLKKEAEERRKLSSI